MFLSETSIKRPVFTTMIMCALAIFGVISLKSLGVDLFPRIELPVITVVTALPGADPYSVETTVSQPIEDALSTISSIKNLRSTSTDSISQVVIEFELEKNIDVAYQEVQAKLGTIRSELPADIEDPVIEKFDIDSAPIMAVVVSGKVPTKELSYMADNVIKDRLQQIKDVGQIKLVGRQERNIWIYLDPHKLEGLSLTIQDVIDALKANHIELPGGRIETGAREFMVKTKAELNDVRLFNDMLISYRNNYPIHLSDVGYVEDGVEEERSLARLNDEKAISLLVRRQSGSNTVSVAHRIKQEVQKLSQELAPKGITLEIAQDLSVYIEQSMHEIQFHLVFGGLLAVAIVFLFLKNLRITIISALAIPLSVISAFILMSAFGFTMNVMTMLALSLAIGILIDDAIVVVENIFRHFKKSGNAKEAASVGTQEIGLAAFAITMSIVAVFLPVAFMKGIMGRFFYQFGVTVTVAVLMSLFVAFSLTPMLSSKFLNVETTHGRLYHLIDWCLSILDTSYKSVLRLALRHRTITICIACSSLIASLFLGKFIKSEFIPMEDQSEFNIKVRAPLGSSLATTDTAMQKLLSSFNNEPWVKYAFSTIGSDNLEKVNEGTLYLKMKEKNERSISQAAAMDLVRQKAALFPDVKVSVEAVPRVSGGGRRATLIQLDITGRDLNKIEDVAQSLINQLQKIEGYVDLDLSLEKGKPELDVSIKRDRAAALGVSPALSAQTVSALIGGIDVNKFTEDGDRYDITVRADKTFRAQPEDLYKFSVRNNGGELVSLENLVEVSETKGPVQIDRRNRNRCVSVFANLLPGKKSLGEAVLEMQSLLQKMNASQVCQYEFSGTADTMKESFANLLFALVLAIVVVYMVLASQFESFLYPCIIMLSLPFSVVGALGGLIITQSTLNIFTMIGIIMLMGLVTKNAILLVDYTNTLRKNLGLSVEEALVQAGATRLHPILMTTLAMIFGMLPIALSHGSGSESRGPMAIAVIGGLTTSMFLTLLVVPVVYSALSNLSLRKKKV